VALQSALENELLSHLVVLAGFQRIRGKNGELFLGDLFARVGRNGRRVNAGALRKSE